MVLYTDVQIFDGTIPRIKTIEKYNKTKFSDEEKNNTKYYILSFRKVNGIFELCAYDPINACQYNIIIYRMAILNSDKDPEILDMVNKLSKEIDNTGVIVLYFIFFID